MEHLKFTAATAAQRVISKVSIVGGTLAARDRLLHPVRAAFAGARVEQSDVNSFVARVQSAPDVIVFNTGDRSDGIAQMSRIVARHEGATAIAVLSASSDAVLVAALAAGASGIILRNDDPSVIETALSQAVWGGAALSPLVTKRVLSHFVRTGPTQDARVNLTPREKDVLRLIGQGLRVDQAAGQLNLATSTVASHIKSIYRKLGINSRAEAAYRAVRMGLLA